MKKCDYCNKNYPEDDFGVALTTKNKIFRRRKCRFCYRETKKKLRKKYRKLISDYKKEQKCRDCGINDHRVLEFHHLDATNKDFDIGNLLNSGRGFDNIKKEIKKCIVICANCHRILHYKE
ncbi:hypothetical protein ACFL29_00690 [Patescibacteria group bacterium]